MHGNTIAHRAAREDPAQRYEEQQRDLQHHRDTRSDPESRAREHQLNNVRRQQIRSGKQPSFRALHYRPDNFCNATDIGTLSLQCSNCGALKFEKETDSLCCSKGKVQLDELPQPEPFLKHLYEGVDSNGKHFLANIRKYNSAFQMTSFGCNDWLASTHPLEYRVRSTTLLAASFPHKVNLPNLPKYILLTTRSQK